MDRDQDSFSLHHETEWSVMKRFSSSFCLGKESNSETEHQRKGKLYSEIGRERPFQLFPIC